jgi:hypothetical protein
MHKPVIIILILYSCSFLSAQSRTNLDVFYSLIDSSITMLPQNIPAGSSVMVYPSNNYLIFNYVYGKLNERYNRIKNNDRNIYLSYAVEDIKLQYSTNFRKKFLGDFYIERNFLFTGNYIILNNPNTNSFSFSFTDTVNMMK